MAFKVSGHCGCGKSGCHSGVEMDDDVFYEVVAAGLYTEAEAKKEAEIDPYTMSAVSVEKYRDEIEYARHMIARFDGII